MAGIVALLNPMSEKRHASSTPSSPASSLGMSDLSSPRKKVKLGKDAAIFTPGPIRGKCRFPPDEYQDEELAIYHQHFKITPFGTIAEYPRHIPYNSEKKLFWERTNRESLEVFQYTFEVPGKDNTYAMLWDYNIGLVRTTALFKSMGFSKTTPSKMISRNPGLQEICHSITGGALVAQGYWVPHAAAKAIAATFCYDIRYALTPVFGHDFPSLCLRPDEDGFGDMRIDPTITQQCIEEARRFREEECVTQTRHPSPSRRPQTPRTPTTRMSRLVNSRRYKRVEQKHISPYNSSYMSDTGSEDNTTTASSTPEFFYHDVFSTVNSTRETPRSVPFSGRELPSPRDILAQANVYRQPGPLIPITPPTTATRHSSPEVSPEIIPCKLVTKNGSIGYDHQVCDSVSKHPFSEDVKEAANVLLSIRYQNTNEHIAQGLGITTPYMDRSR